MQALTSPSLVSMRWALRAVSLLARESCEMMKMLFLHEAAFRGHSECLLLESLVPSCWEKEFHCHATQ